MTARRAAQAMIFLSLAWGALAFGATYAWASRPLMAGCVAAGALAWVGSRMTRVPLRGLACLMAVNASLFAVLCAIALHRSSGQRRARKEATA